MQPKVFTLLWMLLLNSRAVCPTAWAASSLTFTSDDSGTFPRTFQLDRQSGRLTVDLAAIQADARVFRAELVLVPITSNLQQSPLAPMRVFTAGTSMGGSGAPR